MRITPIAICLLLSLTALAQAQVREIGSVAHRPISEISGIVQSHTYPGTYWVHNDSGNSASLFAINATAGVIFPPFLDEVKIGREEHPQNWQGVSVFVAANQDWEDIAIADGLIYLADMGNNGNARRDLGVYVIREPNPRAITDARPLRYMPLEYPDQQRYPAKQWHFDCESLFVDDGVLYFITKHRKPGKISEWENGAKLYRMDTQHLDRVNQLTLVDSHANIRAATGADLSPDGQWQAVISYQYIWLFKRPASGDQWLSGDSYKLALTKTGQVEAIAWQDNDTLIFTNEPGQMFAVDKQSILQNR